MIKRLIELANFLDGEGFVREANHLDGLIKKLSDSDDLGQISFPHENGFVIAKHVSTSAQFIGHHSRTRFSPSATFWHGCSQKCLIETAC